MAIDIKVLSDVNRIITAGRVLQDAPMGDFTSFKAGGQADCLAIPGNERELTDLLLMLSGSETDYIVIGSGTNLLVRDEGYRGIIVLLGKDIGRISIKGQNIYTQAGAGLSEIAFIARDAGLTGLEFAAGIPGTVGGGIYMNAGAFGGEVGTTFVSASVFMNDKVVTFNNSDLDFGYRYCALRENKGVILDAVFGLSAGEPMQISDKMREISRKRREKQPLDLPSAGSFFKRPKGHYAGKLIEEAGLSGLSVGGAAVSAMHAGFIVNLGGARASDIIDLMEIVRSTVYENSGVMLEPEVRIIGEVPDDM